MGFFWTLRTHQIPHHFVPHTNTQFPALLAQPLHRNRGSPRFSRGANSQFRRLQAVFEWNSIDRSAPKSLQNRGTAKEPKRVPRVFYIKSGRNGNASCRGEFAQTNRRRAKKAPRIRSFPSFRSIPAGIPPPIGCRRPPFGISEVAACSEASANSLERSKRRSDAARTPFARLPLLWSSPRLLSSAEAGRRRLPRGRTEYCFRFACGGPKPR